MWVLIFSPKGSQPSSTFSAQRGLYCLWSNGLNSAVAFQERDGALRYAFKLKARGLGIPDPTRVAMTVRIELRERAETSLVAILMAHVTICVV